MRHSPHHIAIILFATFLFSLAFGCVSTVPPKHLTNYQPEYFTKFKNKIPHYSVNDIEVHQAVPSAPHIVLGTVAVSSTDIERPHDKLLYEAKAKAKKLRADGLMQLQYHTDTKRVWSSKAAAANRAQMPDATTAGMGEKDEYYGEYEVRSVTAKVFIYKENMITQ